VRGWAVVGAAGPGAGPPQTLTEGNEGVRHGGRLLGKESHDEGHKIYQLVRVLHDRVEVDKQPPHLLVLEINRASRILGAGNNLFKEKENVGPQLSNVVEREQVITGHDARPPGPHSFFLRDGCGRL